mgnify:CR=1 FL=1
MKLNRWCLLVILALRNHTLADVLFSLYIPHPWSEALHTMYNVLRMILEVVIIIVHRIWGTWYVYYIQSYLFTTFWVGQLPGHPIASSMHIDVSSERCMYNCWCKVLSTAGIHAIHSRNGAHQLKNLQFLLIIYFKHDACMHFLH